MTTTPEHDERMAKMTFAAVYPHYLTKVEKIINPLTQQVRYLDKLVDELAKGKKMEKILRAQ
jgi:hypothetical protein